MFRERSLSLILLVLVFAASLSQLLTRGHAYSNPVIVAILLVCAVAQGMSFAKAGLSGQQGWNMVRVWHLPFLAALAVFFGFSVLGSFFQPKRWEQNILWWYAGVFLFASGFVAALLELAMRFSRSRRDPGTGQS